MTTIRSLYEGLNRPTRARRRAEAMGFCFGAIEVLGVVDDGVAIRGVFSCVCDKTETFSILVTQRELEDFWASGSAPDFAQRLADIGSFSRQHLIGDGYTVEQVDKIVARGEAFDKRQP